MMFKPAPYAGWRSRGVALFAGRLLVRPSVRPGESFCGYRLRVAAANGLANPDWLVCVESGLPKMHGIARWCPSCLATDDGYWREDWRTGRAACLVHQCWLASACSTCRRTSRWKRVRFSTCTCGASLQETVADRLSAEVLKLVGGQTDSNAGLLSVDDRWGLASFLGALAEFGLQGKPLKKASRQTENVEQLLLTTGAPLITDQCACFELLDRLRAPPVGVKNVPLLSEAFPQLLTMLRKQLNDAQRRWMLDLLDRYVSCSRRNGSPVLWERKDSNGQADGELHSRRKTRNPAIANMLVQAGEIVPVRRTKSGRRKFAISDESLQRLQINRRSLIPLKTAARYAGMSSRRVQALSKAGLIASNGTRIDTRSFDRLLGNIATACSRSAAALEDPVSLAEALRFHVSVEASATFFTDLMDGVIHLVLKANKVPALRNIFANRGDVISAVQVSAEFSSQLSIVEAARRLGVKQEVMYHLINVGLIRTRTGKLRRRTARVVEVDDLRKFDEQFMPLVTVAKAMGISAREAPEWAGQHGVEIVTGPSVDGGRQYWIRKRTAAGTNWKAEDEA